MRWGQPSAHARLVYWRRSGILTKFRDPNSNLPSHMLHPPRQVGVSRLRNADFSHVDIEMSAFVASP